MNFNEFPIKTVYLVFGKDAIKHWNLRAIKRHSNKLGDISILAQHPKAFKEVSSKRFGNFDTYQLLFQVSSDFLVTLPFSPGLIRF